MQRNPAHIGVRPPKPMHVPDLRYVYDAIQNGRVTVAWKYVDVVGVSVITTPVSPCPWGSVVASTTGGEVVGWDYLGQMTKETISAAGVGAKAFACVSSAPADATWSDTYGLPYKGTDGGVDVQMISTHSVTGIAPDGIADNRGTWFTATSPAGELVEFSYAVDTTNLHGDAYTDMDSTAIDSDNASIVGTVDSTGAVAITTVAVTGAGANLHFRFPDGGVATAANGAGTVNYTLNPLWMQQYANRSQDVDEDHLITWHGDNTNICGYVDLTGAVEPSGNVTPDVVQYGPFDDGSGNMFYTNSDCMVGFDVDSDPNPDVWYTWDEVNANGDVTQQTKDAISAQLTAQGCGT